MRYVKGELAFRNGFLLITLTNKQMPTFPPPPQDIDFDAAYTIVRRSPSYMLFGVSHSHGLMFICRHPFLKVNNRAILIAREGNGKRAKISRLLTRRKWPQRPAEGVAFGPPNLRDFCFGMARTDNDFAFASLKLRRIQNPSSNCILFFCFEYFHSLPKIFHLFIFSLFVCKFCDYKKINEWNGRKSDWLWHFFGVNCSVNFSLVGPRIWRRFVGHHGRDDDDDGRTRTKGARQSMETNNGTGNHKEKREREQHNTERRRRRTK